VYEYLEKQSSPQKEVCLKLREIVLNTIPDLIEEMKWGVPTYMKEEGGTKIPKYYIVSLKDSVNLGFSIKDLSKERLHLLEGTGKEMRHIKIRSPDEINEERIATLLKMVE
jgi:hypothetical protein